MTETPQKHHALQPFGPPQEHGQESEHVSAWVGHELLRIQRENAIRRAVVVSGLAVLAVVLAITLYLLYVTTPAASDAAGTEENSRQGAATLT